MEYAIYESRLEIRQAGRLLVGSFRYNSIGVIARSGKTRKERFGPRAFRYAVETEEADVNLLVGHSFDAPLASKRAGTLRLTDSAEALTFEATLPEEARRPSWMRDAVLAVESGLMADLSPGFVLPPSTINPNPQRFIPEPGNPSVDIREINDAILLEMSIVTRGVYKDGTEVAVRSEEQRRQADTHAKRKAMIWLSH